MHSLFGYTLLFLLFLLVSCRNLVSSLSFLVSMYPLSFLYYPTSLVSLQPLHLYIFGYNDTYIRVCILIYHSLLKVLNVYPLMVSMLFSSFVYSLISSMLLGSLQNSIILSCSSLISFLSIFCGHFFIL